jgi:hypothetical protein
MDSFWFVSYDGKYTFRFEVNKDNYSHSGSELRSEPCDYSKHSNSIRIPGIISNNWTEKCVFKEFILHAYEQCDYEQIKKCRSESKYEIGEIVGFYICGFIKMIFRDNTVIEIIVDQTKPAIYSIGKLITNNKMKQFAEKLEKFKS